ncbi:oxidoreductase [Streptomyces cyaneogriseus subsp. noncyanogenus]|jgi:CBS domain-containing protein|uniref:Oxidoreductase n=1 Tax=Streptomyces cyaneogriseus subsp. noncyanogenus TaxID=477245 RepID=A0A0C5G8K7_9ACTN|nr:CBS domain-containing protein [Streptomyces cyaneogriseus]AJP04674.1 oxidoreductase [Streptomyces cyaneogriseus subsp. noncyanogenus]
MAEFVKDVMTPGVVAVRPDASLVEAAQLMRSQNIGDVVVADGQEIVGVLTDRDIAVRAVAEGLDPLTVGAGSVCTPDPLVVAPHDPVSAAEALMREQAVRRLPVVENGLPVGMVSLGDLAEAEDPASPLADISRAAPDTRDARGVPPPPPV